MASERTYPDVQFSDSEQARSLGPESRNRLPWILGGGLVLVALVIVIAIAARIEFGQTGRIAVWDSMRDSIRNSESHTSTSFTIPPNEIPANVRKILDAAEQIELLTTDREYPPHIENFDTWEAKRFATLVSLNERTELLKAIYAGVAHAEGVMPCSEPQFVLHAESHGESVGLVTDACGYIQIYLNGKRVTTVASAGDDGPILARHLKASRSASPPQEAKPE